tara:strand:+ start:651 stop:1505 length:855 start_codon:yes stop_codon:yes gene_type:complete
LPEGGAFWIGKSGACLRKLTKTGNNDNLHKNKNRDTMTTTNKNSYDNGIFLGQSRGQNQGQGQTGAHKVFADLYCKHVRLDADQDTVMNSLESDEILDLETYRHLLSETGAEIYEQYRDSRYDYIQACVVDEYLDGVIHHAENKIGASSSILNTAFIQNYSNVSSWKREAEQKKEYMKAQMDLIEKDKLNFQNACLALEGDKRAVAHTVMRQLETQNSLPAVFLKQAIPEEMLLLPSPDQGAIPGAGAYENEVNPDTIDPYDVNPDDLYPHNKNQDHINPYDLS